MTKKQERFVEEYLIDLNATQAAIRAGYSPETAYSIGGENLKKPEVRAAVDKAMAERSKRTGVTVDRVVRELAKIAFVNPADAIDMKTASVKENAAEDDLAAIAGVKVKYGKSGVKNKTNQLECEIKFYDKTRALELLGKHLGMFTDRTSVDMNVDGDLAFHIDYGDEPDESSGK